ncbi:hypothetical protein, partial [Paraclostridium sordellii]
NQINYINNELNNGSKVIDIRERLNVSEKELQRLVKSGGYKYNAKTKNYIKVTEIVNGYNDNQNVVSYKNSDIVVPNVEYEKLIKAIKDIQSMNDKLDEVYKWYELQNNVIEKVELRIDPNNNDTVTRSFKVYDDVYKDFLELSKKHSTYKVQDLISQAIKEFVNKYK